MAVRVVTNGKGETHVVATHYVIDPHGVLHLYAADTNVASYRDWSSVQLSVGSGPIPPEDSDPQPVSPTPVPTGPRMTITADDGSVAALDVGRVTINGPSKRRRVRVGDKGFTVPRGGFGSEGASA